jgi:hypothetical protein
MVIEKKSRIKNFFKLLGPGLITGAIQLNVDQEKLGLALLQNNIFKHFINEEVNIGEKLKIKNLSPQISESKVEDYYEDKITRPNNMTYENLQNKVFNLLDKINKKINDRVSNSNINTDYINNSNESKNLTLYAGKKTHKKKNNKKKNKTKSKKNGKKGTKTIKKRKVKKNKRTKNKNK